MRITGGEYGSRVIKVPKGDLRPTQDMVRSALFSMLAEKVPGCRFLDLFAGTGAVGIEAASRGASEVVFVESARSASAVIKDNLALLGIANSQLFSLDVGMFLEKRLAGDKFDIIYADPPYRGKDGKNWLDLLLNDIKSKALLKEEGLFIMEQRSSEKFEGCSGWEMIRERRYGGTILRVFCIELNKDSEKQDDL